MTPKEEFLNLTYEIKQTGIAKQLYSTQNAEELKRVWEKFQNENEELISKIREWEAKHLDSETDGHDIFVEDEKIENAMEIAICIRLMKKNGRELHLFEEELNLADAIGEIENSFAKKISRIFHEYFLYAIKAEQIFNN